MLSNARAKIFTSPNNSSDSGNNSSNTSSSSSSSSSSDKERENGNRSDHWSSKPIHIYGPPGLANFITMALGLSETGLRYDMTPNERQPTAIHHSLGMGKEERREREAILAWPKLTY